MFTHGKMETELKTRKIGFFSWIKDKVKKPDNIISTITLLKIHYNLPQFLWQKLMIYISNSINLFYVKWKLQFKLSRILWPVPSEVDVLKTKYILAQQLHIFALSFHTKLSFK